MTAFAFPTHVEVDGDLIHVNVATTINDDHVEILSVNSTRTRQDLLQVMTEDQIEELKHEAYDGWTEDL